MQTFKPSPLNKSWFIWQQIHPPHEFVLAKILFVNFFWGCDNILEIDGIGFLRALASSVLVTFWHAYLHTNEYFKIDSRLSLSIGMAYVRFGSMIGLNFCTVSRLVFAESYSQSGVAEYLSMFVRVANMAIEEKDLTLLLPHWY